MTESARLKSLRPILEGVVFEQNIVMAGTPIGDVQVSNIDIIINVHTSIKLFCNYFICSQQAAAHTEGMHIDMKQHFWPFFRSSG